MFDDRLGISEDSEFYDNEPSKLAQEMLLYVMKCGLFHCNSSYIIKREQYKSILLCFVKSGKLMIGNPAPLQSVSAGQVALIDCYRPHEYRAVGDTEFMWIHFDSCFAREMTMKLIQKNGAVMTPDTAVGDKIQEIISIFRNQQLCPESKLASILYDILCCLVTPDDDMGRSMQEPIPQAVAYINDHFATIKNIDEVCSAIGISKFYFIRMFKKYMNTSPYDYLIRRRIVAARHLLKTTAMTVKEIAYECGYESQTGFIKAFADKTGLTPMEYRKMPI